MRHVSTVDALWVDGKRETILCEFAEALVFDSWAPGG